MLELTEVLRGGRQCDEDGVEIIMSREACHVAADEIERLSLENGRLKDQSEALARTVMGDIGNQREPLTTAQINDLVGKVYTNCGHMQPTPEIIVRAIERAHGIGNLPEVPTCTKSQTADFVRVMPTISMRKFGFRHPNRDDGSYGVALTVTGLTSEQQAEAAMVHMQRLFCGAEISEQ